MDILSELLGALHLKAHVFLHAQFCGEWAVDTSGGQRATFHLVARGTSWLHLPGRDVPIPLRGGDLVVFPHDAPHTLSSCQVPPPASVPRNQPSAEPDGPSTTLICGYFEFDRRHWNPLLGALPEMLIIKEEEAANTAMMDTLSRLMIYETEQGGPGSDVVVDRLSEVLFIHVVRTHMQRQDATAGFLAALADRQLSVALKQIHERPGEKWTVAGLAQAAGMSRSTFAARFHVLVGLTPLQYLTRWRMQRAHERLEQPGVSVAQVAESYAYESEAAFSKAFKKHFGYGPGKVRSQRAQGVH